MSKTLATKRSQSQKTRHVGKCSKPPKTGHVGKCESPEEIVEILLTDLSPSPENDQIYKPVDPSDPEVQSLAASMREHKVLEPLVITEDRYILSGHRRFAA